LSPPRVIGPPGGGSGAAGRAAGSPPDAVDDRHAIVPAEVIGAIRERPTTDDHAPGTIGYAPGDGASQRRRLVFGVRRQGERVTRGDDDTDKFRLCTQALHPGADRSLKQRRGSGDREGTGSRGLPNGALTDADNRNGRP